MAQSNVYVQRLVEDAGAVRPLIRLLKIWSIEVKEQGTRDFLQTKQNSSCVLQFLNFSAIGASALWALAGDTLLRQKHIAEMIGINILVDMLMLKSEKLQFISGMAIIALTKENFPNQRLVVKGGGIPPLVRLLRATSTPPKVRAGKG